MISDEKEAKVSSVSSCHQCLGNLLVMSLQTVVTNIEEVGFSHLRAVSLHLLVPRHNCCFEIALRNSPTC